MDNKELFIKIDDNPGIGEIGGNTSVCWYGGESLMIINTDSCPDSSFEEKDIDEVRKESKLLSDMNCKLLLCLWKEHDEVRAYFKSDSSRVRALDFLQVVMSGAGLVKGEARVAFGRITTATLWLIMGEMDLTEQIDYFKKMSISYFEDCDWIIADEYAVSERDAILSMQKYVKKHVPWAVVKSTEVAPAGTVLNIKTLENETGLDIVSEEDTYVMIGIQGEVYNIKAGKFDNSYELTDEPLDIFSRMTVFIPEVKIMPDEEYVSIDEMAHICYPKTGAGIYARELKRRTKVFPVYDKKNYFLGGEGDYLAVRTDDISDIYIIQKAIFMETYEEN